MNHKYDKVLNRIPVKGQPEVFVWIEWCPAMKSWEVVMGREGFPATEAGKDSYFPRRDDAQKVCEMIAAGVL